MMRALVVASLIPIALLSGCDSEDEVISSDGVATSRIYANFQVIATDDNDVFAEAQLTLDRPPSNESNDDSYILLKSGDELWLSAGESIDSIGESDDGIFQEFEDIADRHALFDVNRIYAETPFPILFLFDNLIIQDIGTFYSATLPLSEEGEYRVSLYRDDTASSTESVVNIPESFSLVSPTPDSTFSRADDDIIIEWTNADLDLGIEIELNITCIDHEFFSYSVLLDSDDGFYEIPAGELDQANLSGTCSTTLHVRKVQTGQLDTSFVGGSINAYQVRQVVFSLTE